MTRRAPRQIIWLILAAAAVAGRVHALPTTYTDAMNRASLTVDSHPSTAPGFITYTFAVQPLQPNTVASTLSALFSAAPSMRQLNVGSTVFQNNNGSLPMGETPDGDSQFEFNSASSGFLVISASESSTHLSAAFTGFATISTLTTIAHVVLTPAGTGLAQIDLVIRPAAGGGGQLASFTNIPFGPAAVPESGRLIAATVGLGGAIVGAVKRRGVRRSNGLSPRRPRPASL